MKIIIANCQLLIANWKKYLKKIYRSPQSTINHLSAGKAGQPLTINKGFTLVELLVVISIIAILITIGLSSLSTAQKKERDAKRKSDIKEIQNALEQYYSICSSRYPTPAGSFYTSIVCTSPSIAVMPTIPSDPRGATPYYCPTPVATNCAGTAYTVCAGMEAETSNTFCLF